MRNGFTPIEGEAKIKGITTYDLEWLPETMALRVVGVYDEDKGYRSYTDAAGLSPMERFLNAELSAENSGRMFYAHAGGLADVQFVLQVLYKRPEYHVSAVFSGSSAIIVRVSRGRHSWTFVDSYWTLQGSLAKIGESIGEQKGDCAWDAPIGELITYNAQDCTILHKALSGFQDFVLGLGGELKLTLASTAMSLFRRRFLTRDLSVSTLVNDRLRPSYFGGRVEVFDRYVARGYYYDINSSYPSAMTEPLPGKLKKSTKRIPKKNDLIWFADVEMKVSPCRVPPLPYRDGLTMYFPTGAWRCWFAQEEIEWALSQGHEIVKVHEVMQFEKQDSMALYATTLYDMRKVAPDAFTRQNLKILLNALYGKTAERRDRENMEINPEIKFFSCQHERWRYGDYCKKCKGDCNCPSCGKRMMFPGVFMCPTVRKVAHEHLPIASAITARARVALARHMVAADTVHYCDTDGFASSDPGVPTDAKQLGALKCEKVFDHARFVRPKLYEMDGAVKAKGFPKKTTADGKSAAFDLDDFENVLVGGSYEFDRMPRIKEMISTASRAGREFAPSRVESTKRLQNSVRDKRCTFVDGTTRAWTIEELRGEE